MCWPRGLFFFSGLTSCLSGKHVGRMVSMLEPESNSLGASPGQGLGSCSSAGHVTPIVPLSTQVYKWVAVNLLLGVTLRWTSIPSRGE